MKSILKHLFFHFKYSSIKTILNGFSQDIFSKHCASKIPAAAESHSFQSLSSLAPYHYFLLMPSNFSSHYNCYFEALGLSAGHPT